MNEMYKWAADLFPICRSLTGPGNRQTLEYLRGKVPQLEIHSVASGIDVGDWHIPDEWWPAGAELWSPEGEKILDFAGNNLHLMGYSTGINANIPLAELQQHLHSLPDQPDAIPYVTNYYERDWGLCLTHNQRLALKPGEYAVKIDTDILPGVMNYADLLIPGETKDEILISANTCHPSLANNELSGPIVVTAIARELLKQKRRLTYRIVLAPETIGAIAYMFQHDLSKVKQVFVIWGCGIPGGRQFIEEPHQFDSDGRQYCYLNVPVVEYSSCGPNYPEYHTSADDLDLVKPEELQKSFDDIWLGIRAIEANKTYLNKHTCEPQLGKRGLYPDNLKEQHLTLGLLAYCDGKADLLEISNRMNTDIFTCSTIAERLVAGGVLEEVN